MMVPRFIIGTSVKNATAKCFCHYTYNQKLVNGFPTNCTFHPTNDIFIRQMPNIHSAMQTIYSNDMLNTFLTIIAST